MKYSRDVNRLTQLTMACFNTGANFERRLIYLFGAIDEDVAAKFIVAFQAMDSVKGAITVILSSYGGDEHSGYAIYDTIRLAQNKVNIVCYGEVMSIAALVLQAGDMRLLSPECQFMIHNGALTISGSGEEVSIESNQIVKISDETIRSNHRYHKVLSERSGLSLDKVKKLCKEETFFTAEKTIEYGFADGILVPKKKVLGKPKKKGKK